jgi:hypothetical protein
MIMDSGAFEPANRTSSRFDDTSLKYYKFKAEASTKKADEEKGKLGDVTKSALSKSNKDSNKENVVISVKDTTNASSNSKGIDLNKSKHANFCTVSDAIPEAISTK